MRLLVSSSEAREADRQAELLWDYPSERLMEEAGIRLQLRIESLVGRGFKVYLIGTGNNGGDGLVMARHAYLQGDRNLAVVLVEAPRSPLALTQLKLVERLGFPLLEWSDPKTKILLERADVWIDAVWGTGLKRALEGPSAGRLKELESLRRSSNATVVAVDVPSGLWSGYQPEQPVLVASRTLAVQWLKDFCLNPESRDLCGELESLSVSFPEPAQSRSALLEPGDERTLIPPFARRAHKGTRGHVLILGGCEGMSGAVNLAAQSAAAMGAGLVTLGVDESLVSSLAAQLPAFQVRTSFQAWERRDAYDAVVVGPGWGRTPDRASLLLPWWESHLPLVIDADALQAWRGGQPRSAPTVFTPHPGEFRSLLQKDSFALSDAEAWARTQSAVLVLKNAVTWIFSPHGDRRAWDGSNPALGTGGSGDCLAGMIGALLASGSEPWTAACAGVAVHGLSGKDAADSKGWFTAEKLIEAVALRAYACRTERHPI